ncbi:type II toxin-antitoxin system RelE/ParE family toxin [Pedobacter mucosus]|uniref:type II toxin-antitoxin system RelE/ParE family toxin n=1 Tax=Pedobacter mucosus TaxID=2895286 RepID=UPI001EE42517|nr:type II toxin-antitoxin system RelE/ParE family toxin [Pedobacter mucosus]UKT64059.1 type II toxin-antitoxin system RelE/ParE family toxin [Pedobacter mucosus]
MKIKWSKLAVKHLLEIIQYLEDNEQFDYAEKIEIQILSKIKALPSKENIFQADRLKINNDGSFQAFEIDNYRISFRTIRSEIRILRIRHTGRRPFTR